MNGMPIISNDLRSSCRALLLQSHMGGGKKYDSVYHDILENTVPIIEHYDLGGGFTWTIGEWISDIGTGGRYETYMNGVMSSNSAFNNVEKGFMNLITWRRTLYRVGIVYKDNDPVYAAIIDELADYSDQWNNWGIKLQSDNVKNPSRSVMYKSRGDYKLEGITDVSLTKMEPRTSTYTVNYTDGSSEEVMNSFYNYFTVGLKYTRTISYQDYIAESDDDYAPPKVKKYGERVKYVSVADTTRYNTDMYPFPRLYGGFSDLGNDKWLKIMQELSDAIAEKAGGKILPLEIIEPTE